MRTWENPKTKLLPPLPPFSQNSKFQLINTERMIELGQHHLASPMIMDLDSDRQEKEPIIYKEKKIIIKIFNSQSIRQKNVE